ncbi:Mur ligase family protein [Gorillibacterium massiliense]|uniref:Mur ligase family protein n=1 Tax=Gorillibacterium massiliense TaxID=1280390 RepID=UPI00138E0F0C|nr:UDP-N-acetylmuramoyl-L-alanyl-D-glutamate--2,6-diaminopimelate ligase [Gorillibacterium massiliense]
MKLSQLLEGYGCQYIQGNPETDVASIAYDSRRTGERSLYVCIKGFQSNGHHYIPDALAKGAAALIVEDVPVELPRETVVLKVENARNALAFVSSRYYGDLSSQMKLVGITGTRGKTSTADWIGYLFDRLGLTSGVIGTKGNRIGNRTIEAVKNTKTTPESLELHGILNQMNKEDATHAVLEVTSHALELGRVDFCRFETGVFTNLTPEHLDFHKSLENYENAKLKLFRQCKCAVVNADDPFSDKILAVNGNAITYGIRNDADIRAMELQLEDGTASFTLESFGSRHFVQLKMEDDFGVYNVLTALAVCHSLGYPAHDVIPNLTKEM